MLAVLRVLSRRDLTVAVSHAITFLGGLPVWIAGSEEQKRRQAELIRGGHKIAFAVSEREHGGDLLANEFEAQQEGDRFLISGEKWPIGNATRSTAITLLARTNPSGGPRGFTLIFADKRLLDPSDFHYLQKVQTVGLRGADLSGIRFERCAVPATAGIGPTGSGFELALKALNVNRTLCVGLSLGAGDTALRLAVDFALTRRLYGETVFDIPHARATLAGAFIDLMICDCVAISAARALQACPSQASVWSAAAKYFVPTRAEDVIRNISVVMGARFFIRSGHPWSMFQKMARDSSIISVLEGNTVVQLNALALQLERLTSVRPTRESELMDRLKTLFSLDAPLPPFRPAELDLFSRDADEAVSGIPLMCSRLRSAGVSEKLLHSAEGVARQYKQLTADIRQARGLSARSPAQLELARRFIELHAAACCICFWMHNREMDLDFLGKEDWLSECLNRLSSDPRTIAASPRTEQELLERFHQGRLFSAVPFQLASRFQAASQGEPDHYE